MKFVLIIIFLFIINAALFSWGKKEKADASQQSPPTFPTAAGIDEPVRFVNENSPRDEKNSSAVKIVGRVQIFGSEPRTFAGIVDENGIEYAVYPESQEAALRELQRYLIEFTVIPLDEPRGYAAAFLGGGTVTLLEWKIIR